jgi:hypothetical protein
VVLSEGVVVWRCDSLTTRKLAVSLGIYDFREVLLSAPEIVSPFQVAFLLFPFVAHVKTQAVGGCAESETCMQPLSPKAAHHFH